MLIYEVNLSVDRTIASEYAAFLRQHMLDVVRVGGFSGSEWWERQIADESPSEVAGRALWTVHYRVPTREVLDRYLREHAPEMRAHAIDRFGDRFTASRRILSPAI